MRQVLVAMMCAGMLVSGIAVAGDNSVGFNVSTDFFGKYVWRGQLVTDSPVWQPGVSASYNNFTASVWANMDGVFSGEFTEFDYSVDYSNSLTDSLDYSVGYICYDFPQSSGETQEFYAGLSLDTFLSPSVTVYYDFEDIKGCYVAFGADYSIEKLFNLSEDLPVGLDIGLNIGYADSGYNAGYWSVSSAGFNDLTLSVGFPMIVSGWSVTPSVNYVTLLDDDVRTASSDDDMCFAGVSIGTGF